MFNKENKMRIDGKNLIHNMMLVVCVLVISAWSFGLFAVNANGCTLEKIKNLVSMKSTLT